MPLSIYILIASGCGSKHKEFKEEQIRVEAEANVGSSESDTSGLKENLGLKQIASNPSTVVLTGLAQHRLITIYKAGREASGYFSRVRYGDEESTSESWHYMPGIDLISGYNLLNIAHYDMSTEKLNHLFDRNVLVNSLYYPSYDQDSLYGKPINRDYYLVSVYDKDTNKDTLLNRKDLRSMYYFNVSGSEKTRITPEDYSVVRSQYDPRNDVMYIYARYDVNRNGIIDKKEPLHIFWISLKVPAKAKKMY